MGENGYIDLKHYTFTDLQHLDLYIYSYSELNTYGKFNGVCNEYSVMYVSFMRALNVPARIITVKLVKWWAITGHFFAEIWDSSQWTHSDPTWNIYDNPY